MESLEARVSQAKERYQDTVYSAKDSRETLSALPQFPVNDKFVLNQDEAWYTLSIELQVPIDTVMLQVSGEGRGGEGRGEVTTGRAWLAMCIEHLFELKNDGMMV